MKWESSLFFGLDIVKLLKVALKFRTKELKSTKKAFSREKGQFPDFSLIFP